MQRICTKNTLVLIWLCLLSALNNDLYAQNCCCDEMSEIEIPGGDFEIAPPPAPGGWIDYSAGQFLGSWEVTAGSVSHHDDGHNNLGAGNPNPSTAHLDLNGFNVGSVCQDISGFVIGQEYELVFYYAIHNAIALATATVEIDGGAALSTTWNATNVGNVQWLEASYFFIATAETMDLCFISNTTVNCCGMLIDDIQILFTCIGDIESPEIISMPSDATYQCIDDVPDPIDIEALDDCDDDLTIVFTEEFSSSNLCEVIITRTWTVEDDCENMASHIQMIFVIDLDPPVIAQPLVNLVVNCDENVEGLFLSWIDNFGGGIIFDACTDFYSLADYQISDFESCSENEVTFTFGDFCGNEITETASFTIVDNEAPVFDSIPQNLNVPCGDNAQLLIDNWLAQNAYADVFDNCTFTLENNFNGDYTESQTVTFTATDLCGNQNSSDADITIITEVEIIQIDTFTCNPEQAGVFEIQIDNEFCDSLILLDFILLPSDTLNFEVNTCNILDTGLDTLFLTNTSNCDSLVITKSIYTPGDTLYNFVTSCDVDQVGADTLFLMNSSNCDSLIIIKTSYTAGDTLYNENTSCNIDQIGTDTLFLMNENNCDSLIIVNTTYAAGDTIYNEYNSCDVDQVGVDTLFLMNINSCDSLVVINTKYAAGDTLYSELTTCDIDQMGIDTLFLMNEDNCDSLVITTTFLSQNDTILITEYSCDIEQAEYSNIIIPGPICDTILLVELLPLESDMVVLEFNTCKFSEIGIFTENFTNQNGCDSTVVSNFIYAPLDTIFVNSETCFFEELQQDTVMLFSGDCDSTFVYSTILLEGNKTNIETYTCDPNNVQIDTSFHQNQFGCDSLVFTTYTYNTIIFELEDDYDPCIVSNDRSLTIINPQGESQPYLYSINGTDFSEQTDYSIIDAGTYDVYAQDINGCVSEGVEITIEFNSPIEVSLPSHITTTIGASNQIFIEFSVEPDTFYWSDEQLLSCITCLDPYITSKQDLELVLFYVDAYNCLSSDTIIIIIKEEISDIFIPNVFSPNGDNTNDFFQMYSNDPSVKLELGEIYDRWGNRLYQTSSSDILDVKWDGTSNGNDAMIGVYIYRIVVVNGDGDKIHLVGDVTLVR
jgi:gliding motility-associated-like protein